MVRVLDPKRKNYHCWVTNLTKTNLIIRDIGYTLRPYSTVDVLDYKHSYLTPEKVQKSIDEGDLRDRVEKRLVIIRQGAPEKVVEKSIEVSKTSYPNKARSIVEIEEKYYKELDFDDTFVSDEEFVENTLESAEEDHKPL